MKNYGLIRKFLACDIQALFKRKGYKYFTKGAYNLNIIGVRASGDKVNNIFDDIIVVIYNTNDRQGLNKIYPATTQPGLYYMQKKLLNKKGAAILAPGQYCGCWQIGIHNSLYIALVQKKPVTVFRDNNKDDKYDLIPETLDCGVFGINIHRSHKEFVKRYVDSYSAGCQVFNNPQDFTSFMRLCREQKTRYGNSFTYTLINEEDLV